MFNALIVAIADNDHGRATRVATSLAERSGLAVETLHVGEGREVASTIVEHVGGRDGALLVMTTGGIGLLTRTRPSVTSVVLERLCQPVLLLGPGCGASLPLAAPRLVVGVDHGRRQPPATRVVDSWLRTFGAATRPLLVDVVAPSTWPPRSTDAALAARTRADVDTFAARGVEAEATVVAALDPAAALVALEADVPEVVFVLTSDRWPGGPGHWYSTTRRVVQDSSRPVLVVPGDLAC